MLNDGNRVKEIFLEAAELTDEAARSAYLDRACGSDAGLRERVEALLRAHDPAGSFLGIPVVEPTDLTGATQELGVNPNATPDDEANRADDLPFLSPSTRPDSLGRLGHYEMLQVLGRGGFGIVFRAFDETLQRVVAVKVMAPQIATLSPARKRFVREARSSAAVRHENVVQIYEVGERPLPYLAMEFIPGETLQQKLDRSGPLDVPEVLRIGRQVAEGLAAAHACDLIHRDIKPANVLIEGGPQQRAKITDFGLARAADDASISQSGVIAGTPMYMAPEQALGHKLDQRADLFSLGSVLYQMVAGRPPFRAPSMLAVLKRVAEETPRPISEIIPETPNWLCGIIAKLHAKDPDDRYQSAREVADVLADCEAQLKAHARLKDFSRIPCGKPRGSGRWKWAAVAAVLLLPVFALALAEITGATHLFHGHLVLQGSDGAANNSSHEIKTGGQAPPRNYGLQLNGEGDYVDIPSLSYDGGPVTVEALVQVERQKLTPIIKGIGKEMIGTWLDEKMLGVSGGTRGTPEYSTFGIKLDHQMHHIAGVLDGVNIRLYLDGKRVGGHDRGRVTPPPGGGFCIGGEPGLDRGASPGFFAGVIDEVRVSKVARYDEDFTPALRHTPDKDTLALYHCDEGEGAVLEDSSGNGHHGRIVGAKWVKVDEAPMGSPPLTPLPPTFTNSIGMEFVIVPKGKSWLGGDKDKLGDKEVEIPADFYLGKYEVTQEEWRKVMGESPSYWSRTGDGKAALEAIPDAELKRFPVENVSWDQCQLFVAKLNKLEKETGWVYRLPKMVEWEYACRGGPMSSKRDSGFDFYFAKPTNTLSAERANIDRGFNRPVQVGSYEPNRLGLFDMAGNVAEWCDDVREGPNRYVRGGCFLDDSRTCRAQLIDTRQAPLKGDTVGLRLARVPSGAPSPEAKTPPTVPDRGAPE